jgi:hypothetical protein
MPTLLHGIVFDGETGNFLDPAEKPYASTRRDMQENLDSIYYVNHKPPANRRMKNV